MTDECSGFSESETNEIIDMMTDLTARYSWVKKIYIEAEECDPDLSTNLQPFNEFKAALDHLFRMIEKILSLANCTSDRSFEQLRNEYRSIRGHLCRAFFDIADACGMSIREQISRDLTPYSTETIRIALPDYYPHWRPQLEMLSQKIASYRLNKGSIQPDQETGLFKEYQTTIEQMLAIRQSVIVNACSLQEVGERLKREASQQEQQNEATENSRRQFSKKLAVISALTGAIVGSLLTLLIRLV